MSDFSRTIPPADLGGHMQHAAPEDLVVYAMQLLPTQEAQAIEQHVRHCADCRGELGLIHGDLAALALTAEVATPPTGARERLIAQVAREKRIVPVPVAPAATEQQLKPGDEIATVRPLSDFGRGKTLALAPDPVIGPSRLAPVFAWAGWAVAATIALAAGSLYEDRRTLRDNLASQSGEIQRLNAHAAESHQLMDALTDPHAVRVTLAPKAPPRGPVAGVTYNPRKGTLVFLASNLDPLQTYKTYELWVIPADGSPSIPAGTFHPDEHGSASVIMPNLPRDVEAKGFGVTIENRGGSDKPTLPIIMAGS